MTFADAKQRFSSRAADYARYRPGYPPAVIDVLHKHCGLARDHVIADIGSGTGLLTKIFLANGNRVFAVEPNLEMRRVCEAEFGKRAKQFRSVAASAEATTLRNACVDFVTVGQAFHWFEPNAARREFARILRPGGWVVVMWNDRHINQTPFGRAYEDLLARYGTDYTKVKEAYPEKHDMEDFFGEGNFHRQELPNFQEFDFDGLAGRLRSSSYAPREGHANYEPMMGAVRKLFDSNEKFGRVRMEYTTQIYFGWFENARNAE